MPTYRCDFEVIGDLVLPADTDMLDCETSTGVSISFENGSVDTDGHVVGVRVSVIGPSESMDSAVDDLRLALAQQLDLLTFVTHSRFKIVAPRRLMEWDAGQKKRTMKVFHTSDPRHPPDPEFDSGFLSTVDALDRAGLPSYVRTALKYFRYGLLDDQVEDQFMRIWLSVEIIAENAKHPEPVPIVCPQCKSAMTCNACGATPTRVPMAKQAIEQLIGKFTGDSAAVISKRQFIARNGLMHGRSRESIEAECGTPMANLVNELATLAWHTIMSQIPLGPGPNLAFGHRDGQFANMSLKAAVTMLFDHMGDEPHPTDDKIPNPDFNLITNFRAPSGDVEQ